MNVFQSHRCFNWLYAAHRKVAVAVALICLTAAATSCRSVKEVQIVTDTVALHDTTEIFIHDTTKIKEVKYDSVDRFVEKTVYVDTNGVVHEKEVEKLTHYIYLQDEKYNVMESYYKKKVSDLEKKLSQEKRVEYVEKELSWFQKTLMWCGVGFIFVLIGFGISLYVKLKG